MRFASGVIFEVDPILSMGSSISVCSVMRISQGPFLSMKVAGPEEIRESRVRSIAHLIRSIILLTAIIDYLSTVILIHFIFYILFIT